MLIYSSFVVDVSSKFSNVSCLFLCLQYLNASRLDTSNRRNPATAEIIPTETFDKEKSLIDIGEKGGDGDMIGRDGVCEG